MTRIVTLLGINMLACYGVMVENEDFFRQDEKKERAVRRLGAEGRQGMVSMCEVLGPNALEKGCDDPRVWYLRKIWEKILTRFWWGYRAIFPWFLIVIASLVERLFT